MPVNIFRVEKKVAEVFDKVLGKVDHILDPSSENARKLAGYFHIKRVYSWSADRIIEISLTRLGSRGSSRSENKKKL